MFKYQVSSVIEKVAPLGLLAAQYLRAAYSRHLDKSFIVDQKADDSPVTSADVAVHSLLLKGLKTLFSDIPVVSEEGHLSDHHKRPQWPWYWLVDPLDGTREFVEKTGEYSVNIALMHNGSPWLGFIFLPEKHAVYVGGVTREPQVADESLQWHTICHEPNDDTVYIVTSSRNVKHGRIVDMASHIQQQGFSVEPIVAGSAYKYCVLLEKKCVIYPRYGSTSHWDTAAGQAIVEASGGAILSRHGTPLNYPAHTLLNPSFVGVSAALSDTANDYVKLFNQ